MRSSTGQYYRSLDQIRAIAAYMVFSWHFLHMGAFSFPVPLAGAPELFPLALFDEGHTGVALFMTLSGYLFAKLLDGKRISYGAFLWNRFIRLAPLLFLVIIVVGVQIHQRGHDVAKYAAKVARGYYRPSLPNGGWSVTAEFHFYLLLPFLLAAARRWRWALPAALAAAILIRTAAHAQSGDVQHLAYFTLVGRIDQFLLGMLGYQMRRRLTGRHAIAGAVFLIFSLFYSWFDRAGGFYRVPETAFPIALWIWLPTIEGLAYAMLISWYDNSITPSDHWLSRFIATVGTYSYSIYLLHFFFVFSMSRYIHSNLLGLKNFYVALVVSAFAFLCMVPLGYLSYRFIEEPFLRLRTRYIRDPDQGEPGPAPASSQ